LPYNYHTIWNQLLLNVGILSYLLSYSSDDVLILVTHYILVCKTIKIKIICTILSNIFRYCCRSGMLRLEEDRI